MNRNQELLEKASYPKLLLNLSLPAVVIMLVMLIYNMADTFFIGQSNDPSKIAAISLCGSSPWALPSSCSTMYSPM